MAGRARIGDVVFLRHRRRDKPKRMGMNQRAGNTFALDFRHMADYALTTGTTLFVMRMFFESGRVWAIRGRRSMAIQTDLISRLS